MTERATAAEPAERVDLDLARTYEGPDSGVGAKHLHVGPPSPPYGLRPVMYTEMTAVLEGHWFSIQVTGGTYLTKETWQFMDASDGTTTVRVTCSPSSATVHRMMSASGELPVELLVRTASPIRRMRSELRHAPGTRRQ
jgi:hypothetical protein